MMHTALSESARMVAHSAFEFAEGCGGLARARVMRDRSPYLDMRTWQQIIGLGWPLVGVPEEQGGLNFGADAIAALAEATARVLLPEPLVSSIAAAGLLADCGTEQAGILLAQLVEGKRLFVPVFSAKQENLWLCCPNVPDCYPGAGLLVAHGVGDAYQIRLLDSSAGGVEMQSAECIDGSILSNLEIGLQAWEQGVLVAGGSHAKDAMDKACDTMLLANAAALVGIMDEALQMSVEYMKTRTQFGAQIGTFQALQHRAASCHVDLVSSRALVYEACRAFDTPKRAQACAAAKARASGAAVRVTKECIQFHGAIGFADEHNVGLFFKKAVTLAARQGSEREQRRRYVGLSRE